MVRHAVVSRKNGRGGTYAKFQDEWMGNAEARDEHIAQCAEKGLGFLAARRAGNKFLGSSGKAAGAAAGPAARAQYCCGRVGSLGGRTPVLRRRADDQRRCARRPAGTEYPCERGTEAASD